MIVYIFSKTFILGYNKSKAIFRSAESGSFHFSTFYSCFKLYGKMINTWIKK